MTITPAASAENISIARTLFLEYAEWLTIDLCYQNFDRELAEFTRSVRPASRRHQRDRCNQARRRPGGCGD
jgi:hypothetical protein